jgi:hypothetical protein
MLRLVMTILVLAVLVGCTGQNVPPTVTPPLPTLAGQAEATAQPDVTSDPAQLVRPTLPPTWTPEAFDATPTFVPFVTLTPDGTLDALRALPTLAGCGGFVVDYARTPQIYQHQQSLTVYWGAATGAAVYRVSLFDTTGQLIFGDTTRETSYTFPGNLFVYGNFYGWDVRPNDSAGIQFCMPIGEDLTGQ